MQRGSYDNLRPDAVTAPSGKVRLHSVGVDTGDWPDDYFDGRSVRRDVSVLEFGPRQL